MITKQKKTVGTNQRSYNTRLDYIISLASQKMQLLPINSFNKVPLADYVQHGYKDATSDLDTIKQWFNDIDTNTKKGTAIRLDTSHLVVIDVDINHGNGNGRQELIDLYNKGYELPPDTKIERTKNGGLHYFFRTDKKLKNCHITDNIELKTDQIIIYPTDNYSLVNGDFKDIKELPSWIIPQDQNKPQYKHNSHYVSGRNMWIGKALDSIFTATTKGNRDNYLTSLCGKLLRTGAKAETVYQLLHLCNSNMDIPLPDAQVNKIFKSILKRV